LSTINKDEHLGAQRCILCMIACRETPDAELLRA